MITEKLPLLQRISNGEFDAPSRPSLAHFKENTLRWKEYEKGLFDRRTAFRTSLEEEYGTSNLNEALRSRLFEMAWESGHMVSKHNVAVDYEQLAALVALK